MSPSPVQYYGKLVYLDTKQVVIENPAIWVICDGNGNWARIHNRLKLQNLKFEGSKVPSASAASQSVQELLASLRQENPDISPNFSLPKALGYNDLMQHLEDLGLLSPVQTPSKSKSKSQVKTKARQHISKEDLSDMIQKTPAPPGPPCADNLDLGVDDSTNTPPINGAPHFDAEDPHMSAQNNSILNNTEGVDANDETVHDKEAFALLSKKHEESLQLIKKLTSLLNAEKLRTTQLENQLALDQGPMIDELMFKFSNSVSDSLDKMRDELAQKVGKEVHAAVAIQTDMIMSGIESIPAIKTNTELCVSNIADNGQFLGEVMASMGHSETNLEKKLDMITSVIKNTQDSVEQTRKSVSTSSAQFNESFKNLHASNSSKSSMEKPRFGLLGSGPSTPTPLFTPSTVLPPKVCHDCGGPHLRRDCPRRSEFCVRCLQKSPNHKHWECPSIRECCSICKAANLGEAAFGHARNVHYENDHHKRELICNVIPRSCFPGWFNNKRKHDK